jgi:hypothetical protein
VEADWVENPEDLKDLTTGLTQEDLKLVRWSAAGREAIAQGRLHLAGGLARREGSTVLTGVWKKKLDADELELAFYQKESEKSVEDANRVRKDLKRCEEEVASSRKMYEMYSHWGFILVDISE